MSSSNCCFLTCIQVSEEAGQVVWYSHLFQNFPQFIVIHTVEYFGIVNKAEIDIFLERSCFFDDLADIGNLISGSSAFSKTSLNIWKFSVHVLLKQSFLASSFYTFFPPPPPPHPQPGCPMQIGLARKGCICFTWGSHSSPWIFFCSIFESFSLSLSFSHCHFGLLFPILTTNICIVC